MEIQPSNHDPNPTSCASNSASNPTSNFNSNRARRRGGGGGRGRPSLVPFGLLLVSIQLLLLPTWIACSTISSRTDTPTSREYHQLSEAQLSRIGSLGDPSSILDHRDSNSFLSRILIPRPPDTENNAKVRNLITSQFQSLKSDWEIQKHEFQAETPEGSKKMSNLIFTLDKQQSHSFLTLACHHDSKWFKRGTKMEKFVGATDSASPCAILVDLVRALDRPLGKRRRKSDWQIKRWKREEEEIQSQIKGELKEFEKNWRKRDGIPDVGNQLERFKTELEVERNSEHQEWFQRNEKRLKRERTSLQILFFDGEEAYHTWTHTDSIYGSKSLASNWTSTYHSPPSLSPRRYLSSTTSTSLMDSIEHLILLDLLGSRDPTIPSYYESTHWLHSELVDIEKRLKDRDLLYPKPKGSSGEDFKNRKSFFIKNSHWNGGIEDDHLPFIENGVPVLHVIPNPFPRVWHQLSDDASALDYPTAYAWSMILRTLVVEYLGLDLDDTKSREEEEDMGKRSLEDHDGKGGEEIKRESEEASIQEIIRNSSCSQESNSSNPLENDGLLNQTLSFVQCKLQIRDQSRAGNQVGKEEGGEEHEEEIWEREWVQQRKRDLIEWEEKKRRRNQEIPSA